jgi:cytochrome c peroxidase
MPIEHPMEMNLSLKAVPERLKKAKYEPLFEQAFGTQEITKERVAMALATYVRTLTDNETPFDKFVKGDKQALSPIARQGLAVFKGKGQCTTCHSGPHFTRATIPGADPFAKTGLAQSYVIGEDHGRGDLTKNPKDNGFWRIPSLRGIGRTAPYMHNGTLESLEDVVEFYDRGGDEGALPKLKLTKQEKAALVEFLQDGLTGE